MISWDGHGTGPPLTPEAGEARRWLARELARPAYRTAQPSWFDRAAAAVGRWLHSLVAGSAPGKPDAVAVVLVCVLLCLIAGSLIVFGRPRLTRRRAVRPLIAAGDLRDSRALRRAADRAAAAGDWLLAVEECFRAFARGLDERALLVLEPGATAQEIARRAARELPELADLLVRAARVFDEVRYLGRAAAPEDYEAVAGAEEAARSARPRTRDLAPEAAR